MPDLGVGRRDENCCRSTYRVDANVAILTALAPIRAIMIEWARVHPEISWCSGRVFPPHLAPVERIGPGIGGCNRWATVNIADHHGLQLSGSRSHAVHGSFNDSVTNGSTNRDRLVRLGALDAFACLSMNQLAELAGQLETIRLGPGESLFAKGALADSLYIVDRGITWVHDEDTILNVLGPGGIIGEYAVISNTNRTASVTSATHARLYRLRAEVFLRLLRDHPEISLRVMQAIIHRIALEKDRTEKLLQQVLPLDVVEEYKSKGSVAPRKFRFATVMFADVANFTGISGRMAQEQVIEELHDCFSAFDEITDRYSIRKIKTTGDGYMCAGGIPNPELGNPVDCVLAAHEMQRFVASRSTRKVARGEICWQCRVGVNSGEVTGALIGKSRLTYDVWSDVVNVASRLESRGVAGRVNIGEATYEQVKRFFDCEHRGPLVVADHLRVESYLVNGIKPELSRNGRGLDPNSDFDALKSAYFGLDSAQSWGPTPMGSGVRLGPACSYSDP